ncbi:S24 family peptidase [Comamonas sp. 4034]|uniref:S24 family peptidase n=1 Tax=Comamonas sp. 4034 TaxID=3156455 RepID=UPI003D1C362C
MNTLQERIAEIMSATGMSVGEIANAAGVSSSAVTQWKDGPTKSIKIAPATKLAKAIELRLGSPRYEALWIATGEGAAQGAQQKGGVIALHAEDDLPEGFINIPEYKVHFSAGPGGVAVSYELEEISEPATYRLSWLQHERLNPEKLKRFKVKNGSMEPFLFHGDTVLVNEAENSLEQIIDGKVYAIRYGDELRIKRLYYRRFSGELVLKSDNPAYKEEELSGSQITEHIAIIGRVRDKSGTGGL